MRRNLKFILALLLLWLAGAGIPAGPFPVAGPIFNAEGERIGTANAYPRFVELLDADKNYLGKVGILVDKGIARIHLVGDDPDKSILGWAKEGVIYDRNNKRRGTYFWTPTYSYVYDNQGKRVGSTKCIAWPRVCSVGVAGYLLGLFKDEAPSDPNNAGAAAPAPAVETPSPVPP